MNAPKRSVLANLFSGLLGKKEDPDTVAPAAPAAAEPLPPAPKPRPNPQVISVRKGLHTELRKAIKPQGTALPRAKSQPSTGAEPEAAAAPSRKGSVLKKKPKPPLGSELQLPSEVRSALGKPAAPRPVKVEKAPKAKTVVPASRFKSRNHPIV